MRGFIIFTISEGKLLGRHRHKWEDYIKMNFKETSSKWLNVVQDRAAIVDLHEPLDSINGRNFLTS
jgi:hypothetical protein